MRKSSAKAATFDIDYCVPADYLDRAAFVVTVLPSLQGDDSVFFENVTSKATKKAVCLCVCSEGVLTLERKGSSSMIAFHHFAAIRNFVAPPQGSKTYEKDPAGYVVLLQDNAQQELLFKFDKPQERHLFLNIVTRFASELVELSRLKRSRPVYTDRCASPGLSGNATKGVVDLLRERRARTDSSAAPARKAIKFAEDQLIEDAIKMTKLRSMTR